MATPGESSALGVETKRTMLECFDGDGGPPVEVKILNAHDELEVHWRAEDGTPRPTLDEQGEIVSTEGTE